MNWFGRHRISHLFVAAIAFSCVLPFAAFSAAQSFEPQLPDPGHTRISRQQQQQLGFQSAQEVYKQMPVLPDSSPVTEYVRQVGNRLVAAIPKQNSWPFQFHVVAEKDINAFALPGGEMFVNLGAITAASNEAELAGVMAHEMGHVYMQHSAKQMEKAQVVQGLEGLAGAILGNSGGMLGSLGVAGVQVGAGMVMLKYSRGDEAQADAVGTAILYRAGYNPQALADFFKKLEAQGNNGPQFLSDHPNPGNREEAIQREIMNWPPITYRSDAAAFARARKQAAALRAYTADEITKGAKSGQWTTLNKHAGAILVPPPGLDISSSSQSQSSAGGNPGGNSPMANAVSWNAVAPDSSYVFTDLGAVTLVRPRNWNVMAPQQQGDSISIAPSAGVSGSGIGYGVLVNSMAANNPVNLDQATQQIVTGFQNGQSGLRTVGNASSITVAGVHGRLVNMESTSPFPGANGQSQREKDQLITFAKPDGTVVFMVFIAPESQFERLRPTFERMLRSVQF